MALQWMILMYVVAAEAAIAILLTIPSPKLVKSRLVSLISLILQPSLFIVPFSAFQLLDIYWKNEHRLMCSGESCTASERDRYEKSRSTKLKGMLFCVLHHAFSIGVSTAFASITRRFKVWKKWRRGTRISSSFPCPFPPSAETCGDITLVSCNQMTIPLENYANFYHLLCS
ncbi:unnamed protein product [Camellia sinensis]